MTATPRPAFPLNSPLLPGMALPLRIFEPRYVAMVADLLAGDDPSFVVALITRGHEVGGGRGEGGGGTGGGGTGGGGEERADVGCVARIVEAGEHPDGRWSLLAVGTERVRIERWLDDAPYPVAVATPWPDPSAAAADATLEDRIDQLELRVLDLVALAGQLGLPTPDLGNGFSEDLTEKVYQFATISPIGSHDRHRLLCSVGLPERVELLTELVDEQHLLLGARRDFDDGGGPGD